MRQRRPQGMVLFVVTVVIALISLSAMGFLIAMRAENQMAHLQADQMQVQEIGMSSLELVHELVMMPRDTRESLGGLAQNPDLFQDIAVDTHPMTSRRGRFSILRPSHLGESPEPVFEFGLYPTTAKIPLSALAIWEQQHPGHGRTALMNLPGMTESVADAILDWLDADDEPREFGAESEFYLGLEPPRLPLNGTPARLADLAAVRGVLDQQLLGKQQGLFRVRAETSALGLSSVPLEEPYEVPTQGASGTETASSGGPLIVAAPPWSYYVTLHTGERFEAANGKPKIDLNQGDLASLHAALVAAYDEETADFVIAFRQYGPSSSVSYDDADSRSIPAVSFSTPAQFTLNSPLDLVDTVVTVASNSQRETNSDSSTESPGTARSYRSPFSSKQADSMQTLISFCDATATPADPRDAARININVAPRPVLLAIPTLSSETVDQILNARDQEVEDQATRRHPIWLWVEGVIDRETMNRIWPYVTCGGDVWEGQLVAYYDEQSPWVRAEFVVDGSRAAPRTLYYRDLRRLGRGFQLADLVAPTKANSASSTSPESPFPQISPGDPVAPNGF